jgi:hypothetical protein
MQNDHDNAHSLYAEALKTFQELGHKRGIARLLEEFAYSAAAQTQPRRALMLAGAAAALRQSIGSPSPPGEQAKLDQGLAPAWQIVGNATGRTAWMEGWSMPLAQVIHHALTSEEVQTTSSTPRS